MSYKCILNAQLCLRTYDEHSTQFRNNAVNSDLKHGAQKETQFRNNTVNSDLKHGAQKETVAHDAKPFSVDRLSKVARLIPQT